MQTWGFYLIIAAFALHGAGMLLSGLTLPMATRAEKQGFGHSWLLSRFGTETESLIGTIVWGLAGIGYLVAAIGLLLGAGWWVYGAWLGAPLTMVAVLLWFGAVPMGTYLGGVLAALTLGALVFLAIG